MIESWYNQPAVLLDGTLRDMAAERQNMLTKPPGSLGRLEELAVQLAVMQKRIKPSVDRVHIAIFAGDHGVVEEGVSAFPQAVTTEMVRNFSRGGAAICVLAHELNTALEVINVGTVTDPGELPEVINQRIAAGTANFCRQEAMTEAQLMEALTVGAAAVERAKKANVDVFIGGEMGIGNTTAASALACALTTVSTEQLVGPGTGLSKQGVLHKTEVLRNALSFHGNKTSEPLVALRCLGGFEIAALTGAYVTCAQAGLPVLVDGFIASVAALLATRLCPGARQWFIFAHESQEPGHKHVLQALNAQPLLALNMRLGEGSGAAMAIPLLRLACALHNDMATFSEAGVSEKSPS